MSDAARRSIPSSGPLDRGRLLDRLALAPAVVIGVLLGLPVVALVVRAVLGGELVATVASRTVVDALTLSLVTTATTLIVAVTLGTPLAYRLARRRGRWTRVVETVVDLPIVLPPAVAGLALLLAFGRRGIVGAPLESLGIAIPFTTVAVVMAQTFVAAPFYIRAARSGFIAVGRDLEDAARVDGASPWAVFRHVMVPLAAPALTAGAVLCWARALGEFGATIMFAGNAPGTTQTLPLAVYAEFQVDLESAIASATVLVIAAVTVLVLVRATRRRTGVEPSFGSG